MHFDTLIIGAGASGLMCAYEASKSSKKIAIVDHKNNFGQKILVSGGGRCNFTNLNMSSKNFLSKNPSFVKSALSRFTPKHIMSFLENNSIEYFEKKDGQLFLKKSSSILLDCLVKNIKGQNTEFIIDEIKSIKKNDKFIIELNNQAIEADNLIIATGGLSYPKLGASSLGYEIAKKFGHNIIPTRPALVPFVFNNSESNMFSKLAGISFFARVETNDALIDDDCVFTHKGISGPAILKASEYWLNNQNIKIDFLPDVKIADEIKLLKEKSGKKFLKTYLYNYLPQRLSDVLCQNYIKSKNIADYNKSELNEIESKLHNFNFIPKCTEGFDNAEVTIGGIDTIQISSKTFESKLCKNLFFIGEVLDVTGELGGYNIHFAFASGFAAGNYLQQ